MLWMKVVQAKCPGCQKVLRIPGNLLGESVRCKQCGKVFQIRSSSAAASSMASSGDIPPSASKTEAPQPYRLATKHKEMPRQVDATEAAEEPVSEPEVGVLPVDNVYSPALARYRRRSPSLGSRLAV